MVNNAGMAMINKSDKLANVCYDIRGAALQEASKLEEEGHRILKLNIGNPAPFGFDAPDDILKDVIRNLSTAQGYSDASGIYSARVAVMQYYQQQQIKNIEVDDIYIGNGVSEMIMVAMQALLNNGDEVLLPSPDYPLWTAAVSLSGGAPIHYHCDENNGWTPDLQDIEDKITDRTRALVIINPNNPTGAVYSQDFLKEVVILAKKYNLIIYSDEIYDKILYDDAKHHCIAALADDVFVVTLSGLSKNYRVAGFRAGWMLLSGNKRIAEGYRQGLTMLTAMRMCANVPCQHAIQTALGGYQSINELIVDGGRLKEQRNIATAMLNKIPGVSCVTPQGAMYCFAKIDTNHYRIYDDEQMILDLLKDQKILLVNGSAFNLNQGIYFRLVFLPSIDVLVDAIQRIEHFLSYYTQHVLEE